MFNIKILILKKIIDDPLTIYSVRLYLIVEAKMFERGMRQHWMIVCGFFFLVGLIIGRNLDAIDATLVSLGVR
jgi:hypothetical protein